MSQPPSLAIHWWDGPPASLFVYLTGAIAACSILNMCYKD